MSQTRVDARILREFMETEGWAGDAIDYVERALDTREELLSALKIALRDHQQNGPHHNDLCDLCQMMTQAIAKAEGRQHD